MKTTICMLILAFSALFSNAQSLISMMQQDDLESFKTQVQGRSLDECMSIGRHYYNYLAISIKLNANKIFNYLLDNEVDIKKDCGGKDGLMYAAKYGRLKMFKALIEKGMDPYKKGYRGLSAYDYAKRKDQQEILALFN